MADRYNYFYGHLLSPNDLKEMQQFIAEADLNRVIETMKYGVVDGLKVSPKTGRVVTLSQGICYDDLGNRISISQSTDLDLTLDTVTGLSSEPTSSKIVVSIYLYYDLNGYSPVLDGKGQFVFRRMSESATIHIIASQESASPSPPDDSVGHGVLIADVTLDVSKPNVETVDISYVRVSDALLDIGDIEEHRLKTPIDHPDGSILPRHLDRQYLQTSGGSLRGELDMGGHYLQDLAQPHHPFDIVNKSYIDDIINASSGEKVLSRVRERIGHYTFDTLTSSSYEESQILKNHIFVSDDMETINLESGYVYVVTMTGVARVVYLPRSGRKIVGGFAGLRFVGSDYTSGYMPSYPTSSDYAQVSHHKILDLKDDFCIEAKVQRNSVGSDISILAKTDQANIDYEIFVDSNALGFYSDSVGIGTVQSSLLINDTNLHYVSVRRQGTTFRFQVDDQTEDVVDSANSLDTNALPFLIGVSEIGVKGSLSKIFEVRLWNVWRTDEEINSNKDRRLSGNESGLVGYWMSNEGQGTTLKDSTKYKNHATFSGSPSWIINASPSLSESRDFTRSLKSREFFELNESHFVGNPFHVRSRIIYKPQVDSVLGDNPNILTARTFLTARTISERYDTFEEPRFKFECNYNLVIQRKANILS